MSNRDLNKKTNLAAECDDIDRSQVNWKALHGYSLYE